MSQNFHMVDVHEKAATKRRAIAIGKILIRPETISRIRAKTMPKGDVVTMAEVAGIMAAKNTALTLPLCHPLPIESVQIRSQILEDGIEVECDVTTTSKTGVEMEALCGVNAALLAIYDLTKIVDPVLELQGVRLRSKEGGKSGFWTHPKDATAKSQMAMTKNEFPLQGLSATVITISDRASRGEATDVSGPILSELLTKLGANVVDKALVPDDVKQIQNAFINAAERNCHLIISTGGTGLSPRDVTPEALEGILDKSIIGFGEKLRSSGATFTQKAYLSRSLAGVIKASVVVALPGSPKAAREGLEALQDLLKHAHHIVLGGDHERLQL